MGRLFKLVISMVYWVITRGWEALHRPTSRMVILYYHAIPPSQREAFAGQMDQLLRLTRPVAADSRWPLPGTGTFAAVTFDDAFESVADHALPELEKRGIPCTIFVPTGYLGRAPGWNMSAGNPDQEERVMDATRLRAIASEKVVPASHTISHPDMTALDDTDARRELRESRETLEEIIGAPVKLFSFPHGALNDDLISWAREAGYERVYTITPRLALQQEDEYVTGRFSVSPRDWPLEFRLKVLGMYRWLPLASELKRLMTRFWNQGIWKSIWKRKTAGFP
ncbi:MAG: polysaccharide deacetylase family protein [Planctomycetota bacterium]|jgi:peptidoglycan/xylan/chitin deacetylase (PgdA/CDA1 family)